VKSAEVNILACRRLLLRLRVFLVNIWEAKALLRLIPPPAVILNLLEAERRVFTLGISGKTC